MKQETLVFKTGKEFKKFLKGVDNMPTAYNREVKDSHVKNMRDSVESIGIQRTVNIIETDVFDGKMRKYMADGQHLRKAILTADETKLGGHLVAFVNRMNGLGEIIPFVSKMNSTAKNWTSDDYLESWATHGIENYEFIKRKKKETKISTNALVREIYGRTVGGGITVDKEFKNGELVINIASGNSIINTYNDSVELGLTKCSASLAATARLLKKYPSQEGKFLNMITKNKKTFQHKLSRDAYLTLFKNFLNIKEEKTRKKRK